MLAQVSSCRVGLGLWGRRRNKQLTPCPELRNETLQHRGLPDNPCPAPCPYLGIAQPDTPPCFSLLCRTPQGWPGDEPRGGSREEPGGDVHSAEGPSAAHAEKDGLKRECCGLLSHSPQGGHLVQAEQRLCPPPAAAVPGSGDAEPLVWLWLIHVAQNPACPVLGQLGWSSHPQTKFGPDG